MRNQREDGIRVLEVVSNRPNSACTKVERASIGGILARIGVMREGIEVLSRFAFVRLLLPVNGDLPIHDSLLASLRILNHFRANIATGKCISTDPSSYNSMLGQELV